MKKIFFFLTTFSFFSINMNAQKSYEKQWQVIDTLIYKRDLQKQALQKVIALGQQAKTEKNDPQYIKSLIYQTYLQQNLSEEDRSENITLYQKAIREANEPAKSILQSLLAEEYWRIYQYDKWKIYQRTATTNAPSNDINTWTAKDFHQKMSELFLASVHNSSILQKISIKEINPIIRNGNTDELRPTVYDLLAHRALQYFSTSDAYLTQPSDAFVINQKEAFASAATFTKYNFATTDTSSLLHHAVQLYQQIIQYHLVNNNKEALLDADLARLNFMYTNSIQENKDILYEAILKDIIQQYATLDNVAEAYAMLANLYGNKANTYKPFGDSTYRWYYVKAKELCEKAIKTYKPSYGRANCQAILQTIMQPATALQIEMVNIPQQPFRALLTYHNLSNINCRIIKIDQNSSYKNINSYDTMVWKKLLKEKPLKQWQQTIPNPLDYQQHKTEIPIESLNEGNYILLTSINNQFDNSENNKITATKFYVSDISYIRNVNDFFILNRNTGQPLINASVQVYQQYYNYKNYKYETKKGPLLFADQQGHINIPTNTNEERSITLDIRYKNDRLFLDNTEYLSQSINYEYSTYEEIHFFTDRSIYRPGQTIYFKALVLKRNSVIEPSKVSSNESITVSLTDANNQQKETLTLTTNQYGSVQGKFTIPQGSLSGRWHLECGPYINNYNNSFSVEEYKRPSFYISFDKPKKPYKLNDSVTIKGNAMAYAGYALSNAKVKYSISRESRFFYPWYEEWYGYYANGGKKQIADGNIETEADGSFNINFKAIAENINPLTRSQLFLFTIEADITDLSGETHHQSFTLPIAQQALQIDIPIANKSIVTMDSLSHIMLSTKNLWGEPQASNIKLELISIKETNRLLRQRYWDRPDEFTLSYDQYIKQFPNDIYKNENEPNAWPKGKSVYEEIIPSAQKLNKLSNISPGWYLLKASTKDTFNNKVENQIYVQVYDPNAKQLPTTTYWWQPQQNITVNVNNTLRLLQGSSADNINLINLNIDNLKIATQNDIPFTYSTLSNTIQTITKLITAENQGGMIFSQAFVKHNRFYNSKIYINVPYQNTDLDIQYKTFRDKIEPGSKETWTVQIKTVKGSNSDAEILTSMYDASLDQFIPHQWSTPNVWPRIQDSKPWSTEAGFNNLTSIEKYIPEKNIPYFTKIYSSIFSFNGYFNEYKSDYFGRDYSVDQYRLKDGEFEMPEQSAGITKSVAPAPPMAKLDEDKKVPGTVTGGKNKGDLDNKSPEQKEYNGGGNNNISLRKNFNETAFFYPNLYTDNNGMVQLSFTIPEALTRWKWQVFAHNKDLAMGVAEKNIITQKTLMVQPNWPRFMRQGDKVELAIKVVNVSANEMKGKASLQLLDASTLQPVDIPFNNKISNQNFSVTAQQSTVVHFSFDLPYNYNKPLILRAIAQSDKYSDGEEVMLPVLSNRILVTESVSLNMRKYEEKTFTLPTLLQMNQSSTLTPLNVSVEFSTNPVWYALQALPYLIEYPHECAEQTFNRLYAHAVASSIVRQNSNIANVLQQWSKDSSALMSNLQKNQELKSILLEETPWVQDAADETTQKKWIAQLVDTIHATQEVLRIISQLQQLQSSNGGFMWFKGGPDDPYITQYILTGISRLKKMNAIPEAAQQSLDEITKEALQYADYRIVEYVNELKKQKVKEDMFDPLAIQYIYMRSGFQDITMDNKTKAAHKYLLDNATKYWKNYNLFGRGQLAIALFRNNKTKEAENILASAKDNAINNEEMGMYWKENIYGYYWYQSPIETQAILIEAFQEIEKNNAMVNDLKTWLLQQKQTQRWPTTVSTADACYALLLSGSNWLTQQQTAVISLGNTVLNSNEEKTEAGTGYFKKSFSADNIKSDMGNIKVNLSSSFGGGREEAAAPAWGAVYWQYLEDMNKIPVVGKELQIKKQLYKEIITKSGKQLQPITKESTVKVGDKIIVRLEMRSDRNLEYVHLKDLRASNTEPLNVLSQYKYQDGLGYYESTKDIGTNFFFSYLPKGTYVFEYPLFVNHAGSYSTGVATMQCMYAPVFNSHSDAFVLKAKY